jgi:hypothetical protein
VPCDCSPGRDLRVFFDTNQIAGMDDWRQTIQRGLRDLQVFLAMLSAQYLGEGVAPVFFITLPDAADPKTDQALARQCPAQELSVHLLRCIWLLARRDGSMAANACDREATKP